METTGKELAEDERPLYWPLATAHARPTTEEIQVTEDEERTNSKREALLDCLRRLGILDEDKQPAASAGEKEGAFGPGKLAENAAKRVGAVPQDGAGVGEQRAIGNLLVEPLVKLTPRQNELISQALCLRAVEVNTDLAPKILGNLRRVLVEELQEVTRLTHHRMPSSGSDFPSIVG